MWNLNWYTLLDTLRKSHRVAGTRRRRWLKSTPRTAEVLEQRLCLSGLSIADLALQNDTGEIGDGKTTDPKIIGMVTNDGDFNHVDIELDFNGDGMADDYLYASGEGIFTYDPSSHIRFGEVTIRARAMEWDENLMPVYGDWVAITFTYEDANKPPEIASLTLQNDTGEIDGTTTDPKIMGMVSNDGNANYVDLEFDFNGDGIVDDYAYSNSDGSFTYDPSGHVGFGEVTIRVRAMEWDENLMPIYGEWVSISFTYENSNDPPQVATLTLLDDTGDNSTSNPTITGTVTNDNGFDYVDLEFDCNGDGFADDWSYANSDGTFTFDPSDHVGFGEVTIRVRAVEWDENAMPIYGEWVSISFTWLNESSYP